MKTKERINVTNVKKPSQIIQTIYRMYVRRNAEVVNQRFVKYALRDLTVQQRVQPTIDGLIANHPPFKLLT